MQAKCYYGRQRNEQCHQQYHLTDEIPILCQTKIRALFVPVVKCTKHSQISRLYGWKDDKERLILGKHDKILNLFRWWYCPVSQNHTQTQAQQRKYFATRYCMSDLLVGELLDAVVSQKQSPVDWCNSKIAQYVEHARQIWIVNGDSYDRLDKEEMKREIHSLFHVDTIKKIVTEFGIYFHYIFIIFPLYFHFIFPYTYRNWLH